MQVCVINGSPKGEKSITFQTVLYLQKIFPSCDFKTIHAGQSIKKLEADFLDAAELLKSSDLIFFCYPVYTFLVPSQLHRFIELIKENKIDLSRKAAAQISTSKHFYDTTAHTFICDNASDLKMKYLGGLSADMEDLLKVKGQDEAKKFWELVLFRHENNLTSPLPSCHHVTEPKKLPAYKPQFSAVPKTDGNEIVIVADLKEDDKNLKNMIDDFIAVYPHKAKLVNIAEYNFMGGCLGCMNCAVNGKCVYKDGFDDFLRNEIQAGGKAIVYAFTIKDHSMGARMKMYDDRQFCNGHRTVTAGMSYGYIVNGDLDAEPNLRVVIEARSEVGGNFLAGIATDAESIKSLSSQLDYAITNKIKMPGNFWYAGGMRIFRDLIYTMQGFMTADHKFYKSTGVYDTLPTKQKGTIWKMRFLGLLMKNKTIKAKAASVMSDGMLAPYKKVIES